MFRCAIVGVSGGRAAGLAEAYRLVARGRLVAVSSRQKEKCDAFAARFGVAGRYTDYREMFARERPDLVHVNTPPTVRLEILEAAAEAGIPALLVEKPLAVEGEDFLAIREFARTRALKVALNHQLHFHPRRQALQRLVADGRLGEVRLIEASARMNLAYQGTHSLQAIGAFLPGAQPVSVFGQVSGATGLRENPGQHFAPDQNVAAIAYENGVSALLRCGPAAPAVDPARPVHQHKRIAVYGTRGFVHWSMWGWETGEGDRTESGVHDYADEDIQGQAALTESMFDWREGEDHPLSLERALSDFNVVLGLYQSALDRAPVALPVEPRPGLLAALRRALMPA